MASTSPAAHQALARMMVDDGMNMNASSSEPAWEPPGSH